MKVETFQAMGAVPVKDGIVFSMERKNNEEASLLLYKKGSKEVIQEIPFPATNTIGDIVCVKAEKIASARYEYNFCIDGKVTLDPYAKVLIGTGKFGEEHPEGHEVRCAMIAGNYDWEDDRKPQIAYEDAVMYSFHVRGFTKQRYSGVRHKGTFLGITEKAEYNVFYFSILTGTVLSVGKFMNICSLFFPAYISTLFLLLSLFRLTFRDILKRFRSQGKNIRYVVLVGSTSNNIEMYHELSDDPSTGYKVNGYFDDKPNPEMPSQCCYLGRPEEVQNYLKKNSYIHYLFCCLPSHRSEIIVPIINYCENHLVHFYSVPNLHNYLQNRVYFNMMGNVPYLSLRQDPLSRTENKLLKRTFDIVFSLLFLCTLFPIILIIVTIITKLTMPGPIFFRQKRNGLNDKEFYCYKFRSMKVNAEADTLQATKDDPRKTRWGNIMRKTNIDELPQFINVLLGDMSVVGPRPHMLKHTEEYSKLINKYMVRHFVKPGITGWSQVTGYRGETKELKDMEGRVIGDIWYIEHWSFWLDIYIIYKTVRNAIHGEKNAY